MVGVSRLLAAGALIGGLLLMSTPASSFERHSEADPDTIPVGAGEFEVENVPRGPVTVYTYRPAAATSNSPIWVVMHGTRRQEYRHLSFDYYDTWRPLAERYGAILLVPEFTSEKWPGAWRYNQGNVLSQKNYAPKPWRQTAFFVVEEAFRIAAAKLGSSQRKFSIFGHGAGSQFVQRYVLHSGCRMIHRAVSANPGWYMLPDHEYRYPYGLRDASVSESKVRGAFACNYTLLLGTADINFGGLRDEPEVAAQGKTRFDRGHYFFDRSRAVAARMGAPFAWNVIEVRGVGHDSERMSPPAAAVLAGQHGS